MFYFLFQTASDCSRSTIKFWCFALKIYRIEFQIIKLLKKLYDKLNFRRKLVPIYASSENTVYFYPSEIHVDLSDNSTNQRYNEPISK